MTSLLRSSKFVRYFASLARNIVISQHREIDATLVHRSQSLANCIQKDFATAASVAAESSISNIDRSIKRLDQDVRRTGRVTRREIQEILDEIRNNRHATSTQSLMIIRCCGNLVPEEIPEVRTKLVNEIWHTFENLGVLMDISHYNALLRVYLENEHTFSPSEFLQDLENKGVEPNRVTFQRLISAYCQQGDIEGATRILEFMKEKQMPVNENVFNALILGHSQTDDMESAASILKVMKQANIEPSAETYTVLMCGHAKKGDIDSIKGIMEDCKAANIHLFDKDVLEVVYTLTVNGHYGHIDEMLSKLNRHIGFNQDAKNLVLRLVAKGQEKAAVKIIRTMLPVSSATDSEPIPTGTFIIRQMVRSNRPFENILSLCKELIDSNENEKALLVATEASLLNKNPNLSLKLISALSKREPVSQHYYWPVLVQYGKQKNLNGILNTLREITEHVQQPASGETLREYVVQYISYGEAGIKELRQAGISPASAAAAMVHYALIKKDMKEAAHLALQFRSNYNNVANRRALISAFVSEKDLDSFITLVQALDENKPNIGEDEEEVEGAAGQVLYGVFATLRNERAEILPLVLQKYLDQGIGISNNIAERIRENLKGEELTSEIASLLTKLTSPGLVQATLDRPQQTGQMQYKDETTLLRNIESSKTKGDSHKGLQRQLLTMYCYNKDLEKAEKLKQELDSESFEYQPGTLSLLVDLYTFHEKLPEAMEQYKKLCENGNLTIDEFKLIRLASLLIKNDRTEEAIEVLKRTKNEALPEQGFPYTTACWKLLNLIAEKGDVENLNKVFDILIDNKYVEASNILLGPLIKVHIMKDDVQGALEKFEECCVKYRATPWKNEIACKLIQNEDASALQKLTDLSTRIHGEVNSLYDLVLSFVECGRLRQARKILETPGLRVKSQRLKSACERYTNEGHVTHLENLIELTKDISHIDRSEMYYQLLISYCNADEVDKGFALWTQMQDEDVQPTDQFLSKLAQLLQNHSRPIPFAVPEIENKLEKPKMVDNVQEKTQNRRLNPSQAQLKSLRTAIYRKELDEALKIKEKLKDEDLMISDRSSLLNFLINSGRLGEATKYLTQWLQKDLRPNVKALGFAINNIAKAGDIDALSSVGTHLNEELKKMTSFNNRHAHCMVVAGRAKDLMKSWRSQIEAVNTQEEINSLSQRFPRGGAFSLFSETPELIDEFAEIAEEYRKKGVVDLTNILWSHYTMVNDREKADKLWDHLKSNSRLLFQPIMRLARQNRDLELAEHLLQRCKEAPLNPSALGLVYSCIIDIHLLKDEFSESEKKLNEALKNCQLEHINYSLLNRMKAAFEQNLIPFKYTIPTKKRVEHDSSSSSDSDNEQKK